MANIAAYYKLNAPIAIGAYTVGAVDEVHSFDEWTAIICPGQPYELARLIDTYPSYWTLDSAPAAISDHLVLASPSDPNAATLSTKIELIGGSQSVLDPGLPTERLGLNVSSAVGSPACIWYLSTAGTQTLPTDGSFEAIAFPVASIANAFVTPDGTFTEWEATAAGILHVQVDVTVESGSAHIRKHLRASVDTGGGFATLAGTTRFSSNPDGFQDENTAQLAFPWVAAIGDILRIEMATDAGTAAATLHADGCALYIRST